MSTTTISATEFKAKCLALMDEVAASGNELVITKHGREVCRLVPLPRDQSGLWGLHRGSAEIVCSDEDLFSTGESWESESP